jgi:hypothetical protein
MQVHHAWRNLVAEHEAGCGSKGRSLGYKNANGHVEIDVVDQTMRRHQLVYLYVHGKLPKEINHINGILDDDRPEKLRPATASQRNMHRRPGN